MSNAAAVEALFFAALEKETEAERAAYLDSACGGDGELRGQVEKMLKAHPRVGDFLQKPAVEQLAAAPEPCSPTLDFYASADRKADIMTRTEGEGASDNEDSALEFLQPSTRPDSLGRLGHYEVLQVLGKGGFGIVFRAFDETLQRVVALKVMAPQLAATSPARKRFLREARSSAQVRHENVVQVYEVAEQPLPYLAMEFIPGETLQQRLDRVGPLDVPEVLRIGRQIAEGLAAAHATDLIHRDIKPGNVLLEGGQHKVKITDFGLARTADDASISQSGIIAGTPMYMAPEQALGETLDQRADLFSLGSVLYQMVAGRPPFRANSTLAVLKRVAEDQPRAIREIIPETPQWLCDIIAKLHAKNPDDRYQSAREVADVLADCEAQLKAHSKLKDYSRIPRSKSPRSGRRKRFAAAAAVLLPVIALVVTEFAGVTHLFQDPQVTRGSVGPSAEPLISIGGQGTAARCLFTWSNGYDKENADGSPSVGVYFGTVTPPGRPTELLYLVLYKHAPRKSPFVAGARGMQGSGSGSVEIIDGPMIYGDAAKLMVRLDADPSTGKLTRVEYYTINGQKTEMSRGRLFLIDLTVDPAKWEQVNVELPRDLATTGITSETIRRVAEDEVPALREKYSAVDDFFKGLFLSAAPARDTSARTESGAKDAKEAQEASAKQLRIPVETTNSIGMKLRLIPPGKFTMGSSQEEIDFWLKQAEDGWFKDQLPGEGPLHEVEITQPYYMGQTEVTVGQFRQFVKASGYKTQAEREGGAYGFLATGAWIMDANTNWLAPGFAQTDNHPVVCVSWDDAVEFCQWLSKQEGKTYRLPTEAEREYCCRAGSKGRFCFGDNEGELGNYARISTNSQQHTWEVARLKENPWGLYDMHGNVYEWCQDVYDPNYYKSSPPKDPPGPAAGESRVIRGGSWRALPVYCRSAFRSGYERGHRTIVIGFRVVLVVSPPAGVGTESGAKDKPASPAVAPFTDADVQRIAALPAAEQVEEVRKELMRRNHGFDGKMEMETKIEGGVVAELKIVTDKVTDIIPIRVWSSLRVLDCSGTHTGQPNGLLADVTRLKGMNLAALRNLNLSNTQVGDAGLAQFKDCKALTNLYLARTQVTDAGLAFFKDCKNLTRLFLDHTSITDAGLPHLKGSKKLTGLSLASTQVTDAGLAHFKECKNLLRLYVDNTQVGDAGLAQVKGMPLRTLTIYNTGITDLTPLQGMPLEEIRLTPKNITRGLDILRHMKSLKTIGISWTQFWPAAEFWDRYDKGEFKE
jgi:formylglycine-generating enzyme required for sulfatase activity/serine/threonine protein kinase